MLYLVDFFTEDEILDVYLAIEARRLNKTVGDLETPEYYCEVIGRFFFRNQDQYSFLERSLAS
jgi:hypothetical protein